MECNYINTANCDCDNGIAEFTIVHQECSLYLYLLPILYYDIKYLVECNHVNTVNYDYDNGMAEFTIVNQGYALCLYVVPILYYSI